jgi:5'-3' exonuclease
MKKSDLINLLGKVTQEDEVITNPHERVLLIDGLNLFFRNFAMMKMVNQDGAHVGGLGGFLRSLNYLINQLQPTSVYVVFDGAGSSINRKNLLSEYKSGRNLVRITNWDIFDSLEEEHDSKINQTVRLVHYLKCLPVKTVSMNKVEADDIIAYLSDILSTKHDSKVFIVSNDQDFIQLVNDKITVYRPAEKEFYTKDMVKNNYGVLSENFILYKTLLGDQSDKVGGIKGLGKKGIIKKFPELLERPLSFDDLMDIAESKLKEHVIYARVLQDEDRLKNNYKIMDLGKPLVDEVEKQYLEEFSQESAPALNTKAFMLLYNEDGLGKLMKDPELTINNTFKVLNSFRK